MNSSHRNTHRPGRTSLRTAPLHPTPAGGHRRGGAALIVVISLLGTLAFLGFLFYSFAAQEVASAEYFSRSETPDVPLPPDLFWDWSLKQLIVGTDANLTNSALYGNKYSILANMLGSPHRDASSDTFGATAGALDLTWGAGPSLLHGDTQPFDGAGITAVVGTTNGTYLTGTSPMEFGFDINQDGVFDETTEPSWQTFILNFCPAADSPLAVPAGTGTLFSGSPFYRDYQPDAGYTYPDINSLFLAYDTTVRGWDNSDNATAGDFHVVIPSFFRPQLFPTRRGTNDSTNASGSNPKGFADLDGDGVFTDGLYTDPRTARQVLRPHVAHIAGADSTGTAVRRFVPPDLPQYIGELDADADGNGVNDGIQARSGDTNRIIRPFPFFVDLDGDGATVGNFNEMGVWTNPLQAQELPVTPGGVNYELDVDTDGDGVRDAIWMDLGFPMMTLEDGRQFVPMFAVKIIDADALLNVNAHGNTHGLYVRLQDGSIDVITHDGVSPPDAMVGSAGGVYSADGLAEIISFHQSNQGLSPSEVNLSLALTTNLRTPFSPPGAPDFNPADPRAAEPVSQKTVDDLIATQFEHAWNLGYNPGPYPGGPNAGPRMPGVGGAYTAAEGHAPSAAALSNLEALQILSGRREFDQLRDGRVRENRNQLLGRQGDQFKIRELYRRLAFGDPDYPDGLSDGESLPGPLPGGFNLDDDGDSNQPGLAQFFGGTGDDDLDAPGVGVVNDTTDDNFKRGGGSFYYDQDLYGVQIAPSVHPLDYLGAGSGIYDRTAAASVYLTRQLADGGVYTNPNPSVFPTYLDPAATVLLLPPLNYWHFNGSAREVTGETDLSGVIPWRLGLNPPATIADPIANAPTSYVQVNNGLYDFLIDEPNEVILEPELRNPEYDGVFGVHEMEALHLSRSDASKIKVGSRLAELAPVNLKRVKEEVRYEIARRLTTDSWDRLEPGQSRWRSPDGGITPAFRFWEYNVWNAGDSSAGDFFTVEETFPPQFGPSASPILAGTDIDPFRPELRLLLKNERLFSGSVTGDGDYPRKRLNINRILSGEEAAVGSYDRRAFDDDGNPRFRQLTPHPNITELLKIGPMNVLTIPGMVHDNVGINNQPGIAPPFSNLGLDPNASQTDRENLAIAQEWWARYDRQRMCRDIYTLLYTLGGGDDSFDPTIGTYDHTNPDLNSNTINDNVEAMAQFAVNYVDGLDHDNVITKFEYDINLADGWQWTAGAAFVNGIEAQQLTFSEAIWIRQPEQGSDYTETGWDDSDREHQFLHMELRSTTPFPVELADETWRIVRVEIGGNRTARLNFRRNGAAGAIVPAGEVFTIGTNDGHLTAETSQDSADLVVDVGSGPEAIVPDGSAVPDPAMALPLTDLDLVSTNTTTINHPGLQIVEVDGTLDATVGNNPNAGTMVGIPDADTNVDTIPAFDLVLERRRHLNAENLLGQADDPLNGTVDERRDWIEVDRMRVWAQTFNPDGNANDVAMALGDLRSSLRLEPLSAPADINDQGNSETTGNDPINHTILEVTSTNRDMVNLKDPTYPLPATLPPAVADATFELWQPHFDRDYSSVFELLAVPLFGPEQLTQRLAHDAVPNDTTLPRVTGEYYDVTATAPRPALAGRFFMNTDPLGDTDYDASTGIDDDNRWYRLFEFLEVPNRAEEAIRERLTKVVRTPGKINLNTLRDEQALAALVDDLFLAKFTDPNGRMTTSDPGLEPLGGGSDLNPGLGNLPTYEDTRNWMDELRLARDGIDPVNFFASTPDDRTYLPLPGIPGMVGDPNDTAAEYTNGRPQFGAVPFRPLSYVNPLQVVSVDTNGSVQDSPVPPTAHTILRSHIGQVSRDGAERIDRKDGLDALQLFEARPTSDVGLDEYDYHTRNRLLAKLANNSTERSNVFICWIVVEFFEAHQPDPVANPQIVQVGGKLEGSPTHRGFFVIDRSRIERAVDEDSISIIGGGGPGRDANFKFDWRDFVIHRRTIQ